ncbi:MAG: hypothetical protein ACK51L_01540 [bacterium]
MDLLGESLLNRLAVEPRTCLECPSFLLKTVLPRRQSWAAWSSVLKQSTLPFLKSQDQLVPAEEACENPCSLGSDPVWED